MTTSPTCVHCGFGFTTQEALHGEVLQTDEGLIHEHCGDEFDVAENERRREHGDPPVTPWSEYPDAMIRVVETGEVIGIDWKLATELPADGHNQAERYRSAFARARGSRFHEAMEAAVRGHG